MKISVENIDEKVGLYTTRILKIKIGSKSIRTPYRAITHQELNAKNNIPEDVLLHSHFSIIYRKFTLKDIVEKIFKSNKYLSNLIKFLEMYRIRMQHSDFILSFLQPYESAINVNFDKGKYIRLIVRVQLEAGFRYISIPWLKLPEQELIATIEKHKNELTDDYQIIPVIDIKEDSKNLQSILEYVKECSTTGELSFLGVIYRPVREALASYDLAWDILKESELCVFLLDVERVERDLNDISGIHLNEFVLGDIISSETIRIFTGEKKLDRGFQQVIKRKKPIEEKIRIFDRKELRVPTLREIAIQSSDWIDEIVKYFNRGQEIRKILKNYKEAEEDKEKTKVLNAISRVHEFLASEEEMEFSHKFILKDETEEYIKEKSSLLIALKSVKGQRLLRL